MFGKELETINALVSSADIGAEGDDSMTNLTALIAAERHGLFLGEQDDLAVLDKESSDDDIDASYGETLDTLAPAVLVRLTEKSCAA